MISYTEFVFSGSLTDRFDHSGVLSPAISLDPKYRVKYSKRRDALNALQGYVKEYVTARKAVFWCALHDRDVLIRHQARELLKAKFKAEWREELELVYPDLVK